MSAAFGIRFGATTASLAVFKDGKTDVVANENGDRVTPAIVAFTAHDQAVGLAAKQGLIRNASNTICNVKRLLGVNYDDPVVQKYIGPVNIINRDGTPVYEVTYKEKTCEFNPREVATVIFQNLLAIAERHGEGNETHDAVIAVPLNFTEAQRKDLCTAAEKAGFNILRVISEPSAATLAYDISQADHSTSSDILVYRLGGTTSDITVLEAKSGMYRVLASAYSDQTAGTEITMSLVKYFAAEFKRQWKCDPMENKRAVAKLTVASETAKHILSTINTTTCSVESLCDGIDFQCSISRSRLEGLVSGLVSGCMGPIEEVLAKAGLSADAINKVILVGGGCRMPMVKSQMQKAFPGAEFLSSINPDEVVAIGAAKEAGILIAGEEEERDQNERETRVPCLPGDILVECLMEGATENVPVFTRNTPVPTRQTRAFQMTPEQTCFSLNIVYSDGTPDPVTLAKVVMKDLPAGANISGNFHMKSDGSLHVTCTEPTSNKTQDVVVEGS